MEAMQAFFEREGNIDALADNVVPMERTTEKESPMRAEMTVAVSQATLRDGISSTFGLIKNTVIALVTPEVHNEMKKRDNLLQSVLQDLVNQLLNEQLNFI